MLKICLAFFLTLAQLQLLHAQPVDSVFASEFAKLQTLRQAGDTSWHYSKNYILNDGTELRDADPAPKPENIRVFNEYWVKKFPHGGSACFSTSFVRDTLSSESWYIVSPPDGVWNEVIEAWMSHSGGYNKMTQTRDLTYEESWRRANNLKGFAESEQICGTEFVRLMYDHQDPPSPRPITAAECIRLFYEWSR